MRICVVGCGAIGSIYAAHLALRPGVEVWAFDTDESHVEAINQHGLQLVGVRECSVSIYASADITTIPNCDFGIIATKSEQTKSAIETTAHLFRDGIVCSLQNGFGNEEIIAAHVDGVVSGTVMIGGHVRAPGVVEFDSRGVTWIGRAHGHIPTAGMQTLAELLSAEGLETIVVDDPKPAKWTKLIFNAAANPLCALTRLPFGEVHGNESLRNLMYGLAGEGIAVARALDVVLETNPRELLDGAAKTAATHLPSMLSDVLHEKVTEVDSINGHIVRQGIDLNIECPLNALVLALVQGLESSWR